MLNAYAAIVHAGTRSRTRLASALAFLLLALAPAALAGQAEQEASSPGAFDWRLEREEDGIRVFTRAVEDSPYRAVRATMELDVAVSALVALVMDTDACPEWAAFCKEAFIVEPVSETEAWIYTHNDMPWPVTDRDAVSHVRWYRDLESGAVWMDAIADPEHMPEERGRVRLRDAVSSWRFAPLAHGTVEVSTEAHVDPAGPVPAWITNRLLVDAPLETMQKMRAVLATGRYDDASPDFLAETSR